MPRKETSVILAIISDPSLDRELKKLLQGTNFDLLDTMLGVEQHRIVHLKDVTERMSIYQDMRRFHTVVAHKLRTPMSMLVSSMALIRSHLDQLSGDEVKELVRAASRASTGWHPRYRKS